MSYYVQVVLKQQLRGMPSNEPVRWQHQVVHTPHIQGAHHPQGVRHPLGVNHPQDTHHL